MNAMHIERTALTMITINKFLIYYIVEHLMNHLVVAIPNSTFHSENNNKKQIECGPLVVSGGIFGRHIFNTFSIPHFCFHHNYYYYFCYFSHSDIEWNSRSARKKHIFLSRKELNVYVFYVSQYFFYYYYWRNIEWSQTNVRTNDERNKNGSIMWHTEL